MEDAMTDMQIRESQIRESLSGALELAKEVTQKITLPLGSMGNLNISPNKPVTFKPLKGSVKKVTEQNLEARILELNLTYNWNPELLFFR